MARKYPGIVLLTFVVIGILSADVLRVSAWMMVLLSVGSGLVGFALYATLHRGASAVAFLVGVAGFAGAYYALAVYDFGPRHIRYFIDPQQRVRVVGYVNDWPEPKHGRLEVPVAVDSIGAGRMVAVHGGVLLRITDTTALVRRGDRVAFESRLYPPLPAPPGGFDYRRYLLLRGIYATAYLSTGHQLHREPREPWGFLAAIDGLRGAIVTTFNDYLSPTSAALAAGFLIGETQDIPLDVYSNFRDSGTLHLLAVSGSNVALVLGFMLILLRPLGLSRAKRAPALIGAVIVFAALSYAEPSVIRASVMALLVLLAGLIERRTDLNNIVAMAAALILLAEPAQLFDVGFQLSFVTAWGLVYVMPRLYEPLTGRLRRVWLRPVVFALLVAGVAQLFSWPLIALYFQRVPVVSWVANIAIVPVASASVISILILLMANLLSPYLAAAVAVPVDFLLQSVIYLLGLFGGTGQAVLRFSQVSMIVVVGYYVLLVLAAGAIGSRKLRRAAVVVALLLVNAALLIEIIPTVAPDQRVSLHLERIPGGVAVLVSDDRGGTGDLILTDLETRPNPPTETVLEPMLRRHHVEDLRCLTVLRADFDVVEPLLRFAEVFHSDTLFISDLLEASVADVLEKRLLAELPVCIRVLGVTDSDPGRAGVFSAADFVEIRQGRGVVWIIDDVGDLPESVGSAGSGSAIICGSDLTEGQISSMEQTYPRTQLICAGIRRSTSVRQAVPDGASGRGCIDLQRHGYLRLYPADSGFVPADIFGSD